MRSLVPLALALLSGCVTVYEPMGTLQRPVVVDPRLANFSAARIFVRCLPTERRPQGLIPITLFPSNDADQLCQKVRTLFANQGADVETAVAQDDASQPVSWETGRPDLIIDLKSRVLVDEQSVILGVLCCYSYSLIPAMSEQSFAVEVVVRDGDGLVLASDTLKSRFVTYTGCGVWGVNWLLDLLARPDDQDLTGEGPQRDHSRDFYGQLSQLAFNARVRAKLLGAR